MVSHAPINRKGDCMAVAIITCPHCGQTHYDIIEHECPYNVLADKKLDE
jgi:4-hydroxy-3-methylbut-2-en-1-yl diphosphate synthase IspG/GcpE